MDSSSVATLSKREALARIREHTEWPITDCAALLQDHVDYNAAIQHYEKLKDYAEKWNRSRDRAIQEIHKGDFWLADFFNHNVAYLCSSSDPKLNRWGSERKRLDDFLQNNVLDRYATIKAIYNPSKEPTIDVSQFSNEIWRTALTSGRIPRFEPDWLHAIKEDPMCKLRILQSRDVAKATYCQEVRFVPKKIEIEKTAKYISESIIQAEQYLLAAEKVEIRVRPLLLYYAVSCLVRAILALRIPDLLLRFKSHGLQYSTSQTMGTTEMGGIHAFQVLPTKRLGLFSALVTSYGDVNIEPSTGPWSLAELLSLIPELSATLSDYAKLPSKCGKIIDFFAHTEASQGGNTISHFSVTNSFLSNCGSQLKNNMSPTERITELERLFPRCLERNRSCDPNHDPWIRIKESLILGELVTLGSYQYSSHKNYRNLYPLLFNGGVDGNWYLVYNNGKNYPHQLVVIMALLYGMSMLVRYKPIEWSEMLSGNDGTREVINEFTQICRVKIPALATEELLHRRILGSLDQIPH